jgi:D-alanine transaminase
MGDTAYLNGKWMKIEEAMVPAEDRGYLFGDGLYEAIVSYDGRLWALDRHLLRLAHGIRELEMEGIDVARVRKVIEEAAERSGMSDVLVYLQLTRGAAPRSHDWSPGMKPSLFVSVRKRREYDPALRRNGVSVITTPDLRWGRVDIKTVNLLANCLAQHKAHVAGAFEAVFIRSDGTVAECSSSSLFIVKKSVAITREDGPHILPGITQGLLIEAAERLRLPCRRRPFTKAELLDADEVFLAGTTTEVLAVTRIDGRAVADGKVGNVTKRFVAAYVERIKRGDDAPCS